MDTLLKSIYYNSSHPAGYSSIDKLAKASGIDKNKVKEWLKKQPTYTLHQTARKSYETRKYIVHAIDEQWQADLCDMTAYAKKNEGHHFILTVIDIFSRYAWARPLKSKRGVDVANAFKDIFDKGRIPKRIQTDQGKEFENKYINNLFRQHNIELFSIKSAYKAALVERFNRTLKAKMWKYFTANITRKWTPILQDLVDSYNKSKHRSIGKASDDVSLENERDIWERVYSSQPQKTSQSDIKVGDKVRISKVKSVFDKGYLPNWTEEIFYVHEINKKFTPTSYKLRDYEGEVIEGSFHRQEIQPIIHDDDTFLVEKIIQKQKRDGEEWCLVKWLGYPRSMNSWVRRTDIIHLTQR